MSDKPHVKPVDDTNTLPVVVDDVGKHTLWHKLIRIRKAITATSKDGRGQHYDYVTSSNVLHLVRPLLDAEGVLVVTSIEGHKLTSGTTALLTELDIRFTIINADDPDDNIEIPWYSQGIDETEVGVGQALTYAEKYFFLKLFHIPTDGNDPDRKQSDSKAVEDLQARVDAAKKKPKKKE